MLRFSLLTFLLLATFCFAGEALAQDSESDRGEMVERVVAWVGKEPVMLSEVEEALVRFEGPSTRMTEANLRKALEQLIDEILLYDAAKKAGVEVLPEALDARVDKMMLVLEERNGGREKLEAYLKRVGETSEKLRKRLREQERRELSIGQAISGRVVVSDSDVARFVKQREEQGLPIEHIYASHAIYPLSPDAPDERYQEIRAEMYALRLEAIREDNFLLVADKWAKKRAREGAMAGGLGRISLKTMQSELVKPVAALQVGEISEPIRTKEGIGTFKGLHLIRLDRRISAREILFSERFKKERAKWLKQLRSATIPETAPSLIN